MGDDHCSGESRRFMLETAPFGHDIKETEGKHSDISLFMGSSTKVTSKGSTSGAQSETFWIFLVSKDQEIMALKAQIEQLEKEKEETAPKHAKKRKEM